MLASARVEGAAVQHQRRQLTWIVAALWILVAGVIHLLLLKTRTASGRNICGIAAAVLGVVAAIAYFRDSILGPKRSTWALLLLITCALIVCVVVWNILFLRYIKHSGYQVGNFRKMYQTKHAPLYGVSAWPLVRYMVWPILGAGAALIALLAARGRLLSGRVSAWWFVLLQLVLTVSFALSDGPGWLRPFENHHYLAETNPTTRAVQPSIREMLHDYDQRMPEQGTRLAHYPPGFVLYRDYLVRALHIRPWQHHLMMLLVCLTPLPLGALMRELGMKGAAATLGLMLFSTAIGVLSYTRADFSVPAVPLAVICLWLLLRGARTGEWWAGVMLGITFAAFTMYVFTSLIVGVVMALIVAGGWLTRSLALRNTLRTVAVGAVVFVGIFVALYAWSRFNIYECLQQGRADEREKFGSGFDDPTRYALRSTGHVLAYVVGSGYALSGLALMALPALWRGRVEDRMPGVFAWAVLGAILFAGFNGAFHGETERVWLFFTPMLAALAGYEWQRRTEREGAGLVVGVIVLVLVGNCAQELLYRHQPRNIRRDVPRHRAVQIEEMD
jgi:hypothetical protein